MVVALRAMEAILAAHEDDELRILVDDSFKDILGCAFPDESRFICYPRRQLHEDSLFSRIRTYFEFAKSLRSIEYDCALDMDGTVVSARLMRLARARRKLGPAFNKNKRRKIYTELIEMDQPTQHCFDDFSIMIDTLGLKPLSQNYYQFPPFGDMEQIAKLLGFSAGVAREAFLGSRIVVLHVCATKDYKQWDIAKFANLADSLVEQGLSVIVVGAGESERARIGQMFVLSKHRDEIINGHNKLSLVQLVTLLQHAKLYIGNDSGPMHLASASGVPLLALFGPTELVRWHPRVPQVRIVKGDALCSPDCQPEVCLRDYQCMSSLSVEKVQREVDRALSLIGRYNSFG